VKRDGTKMEHVYKIFKPRYNMSLMLFVVCLKEHCINKHINMLWICMLPLFIVFLFCYLSSSVPRGACTLAMGAALFCYLYS